jgi:hypothetical protein
MGGVEGNTKPQTLKCRLQERPTRPRVLWGESPLPSIARFRRLVYPGHGEVTNRGVLGSKSHGCPVLLVWNCGGSDLGGEQTWGPEHNEMTAASLTVPYWSRCAGKCGSRPSCNLGKADVLWEETGICTIESYRGKGPGTWGKTCGDNVGKGHLPAGTGDNLQRPAVYIEGSGRVLV